MVYDVREDSLFLCKITRKYLKNKNKEIKVLDLGTGSGIQSKCLMEIGIPKKNILAVDINPKALKQAKKLGVKILKSDLFKNIKSKFNLIVFNPPYLPESNYDKEIDTTGGKKGDETIIHFIKQLKQHLTKNGVALLLTSSHTPNKEWKQLAKNTGLKVNKIATKGLFFEKLYIYQINLEEE